MHNIFYSIPECTVNKGTYNNVLSEIDKLWRKEKKHIILIPIHSSFHLESKSIKIQTVKE